MNDKSLPQSLPKREPHSISVSRRLRLFLLVLVSGLTATIISGCTPALVEAAIRNDITEVETLLDKGTDINAKDPDGITALHEAAFRGHTALVELLLARGADVNARSDKGVTPLYAACRKDNTDIINLLLENGADVHARDNDGAAPLYCACQEGHLEVVKILLRHDADIDDNSFDEITPLMMASGKGHQEIVHFLLEEGADVNAEGERYGTSLSQACTNGHLEVVTILLEHGAEVNIDPVKWKTPLYIASSEGYEQIVHALVEDGGDINAQNRHSQTALYAAARNDHWQIVDYLISKGGKPNVVEKEPGDIYVTARLYELSAKHCAEQEDRETTLEYLRTAANSYNKASQQCQQAAQKIGREIRAAEAAALNDFIDAWSRLRDKDSRRVPRTSPRPMAKQYSDEEFTDLVKTRNKLLQMSSFCDDRAAACNQALECCQDAESDADLQDCLKKLENN